VEKAIDLVLWTVQSTAYRPSYHDGVSKAEAVVLLLASSKGRAARFPSFLLEMCRAWQSKANRSVYHMRTHLMPGSILGLGWS
jgi:hypothetical protein